MIACEALHKIVSFPSRDKVVAQFIACKGEQEVLVAINNAPSCCRTRLYGCSTLLQCYLNSPQNAESKLEEAIMSLVGGMATFSNEVWYQMCACRLLRDVTQNQEGIVLACKAGGIHALFRARRMASEQVMTEANSALDALRKCGESVTREIDECEERERCDAKIKKGNAMDSDSGDVVVVDESEKEQAREKRNNVSCVACGKHAHEVGTKKLLKCDACTIAPRYCSIECQKAMWPTHKADCKAHRIAN